MTCKHVEMAYSAVGPTLSVKSVLIYLAFRANKYGWSLCSYREIGEATGLKRTTVYHALKKLSDTGFITITPLVMHGALSRNSYKLKLPWTK